MSLVTPPVSAYATQLTTDPNVQNAMMLVMQYQNQLNTMNANLSRLQANITEVTTNLGLAQQALPQILITSMNSVTTTNISS